MVCYKRLEDCASTEQLISHLAYILTLAVHCSSGYVCLVARSTSQDAGQEVCSCQWVRQEVK